MVITETYRENAKTIKKVVNDTFSLSEQSYTDFCRYIDDPLLILNDKAKELLEKYSDEVVDFRIPVDTHAIMKDEPLKEVYYILEVMNNVLFEFYKEYRKFDNNCILSYDTIASNKVVIFGEERKVYRFLCSHSEKIAKRFLTKANGNSINFSDLGSLDDFGIRLLVKASIDYLNENDKNTFLKTKIDKIMNITSGRRQYDLKTLTSIINDLFRITADIIGALVISNKSKYKSFLSFNFADWFLASSGEDWSSCIGLDSGSCYSWGLPGLLACPDWGMLMVAKDDTKSYLNIKVPFLLARSWVIYGTNEKYNLVNWYPHDLRSRSTSDLTLKNGDIVITKDEFNPEGRSYSWYKPFYLRNGSMPFIYSDCYGPVIAKSGSSIRFSLNGNKAGMPFVYYQNGVYTSNSNGEDSFSALCDLIGETNSSIGDLICEREDALEQAISGSRKIKCECCEDRYYEEDLTFIDDYGYVCDGCLENSDRFSYCDSCSSYYVDEDMTCTADGEYVCSGCLDSYYAQCDICGEFFKDSLITTHMSETGDFTHFCPGCLREEQRLAEEEEKEEENKKEKEEAIFYENSRAQ